MLTNEHCLVIVNIKNIVYGIGENWNKCLGMNNNRLNDLIPIFNQK